MIHHAGSWVNHWKVVSYKTPSASVMNHNFFEVTGQSSFPKIKKWQNGWSLAGAWSLPQPPLWISTLASGKLTISSFFMFWASLIQVVEEFELWVRTAKSNMEDGKMANGPKNVDPNISWPMTLATPRKWFFLSCRVPVKSPEAQGGQWKKRLPYPLILNPESKDCWVGDCM